MRTAASFKSHPIHASLVSFPFAFLLGAFAFDVTGRLFDASALWQTGRHLTMAGIVAALVAAVPGFVDYFRSVPPQSSARVRATNYMLLNLATVGAFAVAFVIRDPSGAPGPLALLLEAVAATMLLAAGWMGGTLVARNQIGVDHRYAGAGTWREESFDFPHGQPIAVASDDEPRCLARRRRHDLRRRPMSLARIAVRCPLGRRASRSCGVAHRDLLRPFRSRPGAAGARRHAAVRRPSLGARRHEPSLGRQPWPSCGARSDRA